MRNFKAKAICLFSSAVLLCGASSMTANAATYNTSATSRPTVTVQTITGNYYLNKTDVEIESGKSAVINVVKSSSYTLPTNATVSYQWYKNDSILSGETKSSLTVTSTGSYYCVVKVRKELTINIPGKKPQAAYTTDTYTTNKAAVSEKLVITQQPAGGVFDNEKGYFDMFVSVKGGTGSYTYKWYWNGKETSLTGRGMRVYNSGTGYCVITDTNGKKVTTQNATVTYAPLKITSQPTGGYILTNDGYFDMYVTPTGGKAPYKYKWYWNDKETSLTGNGMRVYGSGTGYCVITDAAGNKIASNNAVVKKSVFSISNHCCQKYAGYLIDCEGAYKPALESLRIYVPTYGGTGKYKYTWEVYTCAMYAGKESGFWLTLETTSENYVDLDFDDLIYTSYNYDELYKPYTTKHYERRIRCRVSTLDENGKALATKLTGESLVHAFDPAVVNPYDPNWPGRWE